MFDGFSRCTEGELPLPHSDADHIGRWKSRLTLTC